jgi:transcriptional regulator with XRE-family HTH domain
MKTNEPRNTAAAGLLTDARRRAALTQEEVARRAGVARPSISQYETGKKDPTVNMLYRLIEACGMELRMSADPLRPTERAQALRDAAVGPVRAHRNAKQARSGLVQLRRLTPAERDARRV